jgi:hypothetical protein
MTVPAMVDHRGHEYGIFRYCTDKGERCVCGSMPYLSINIFLTELNEPACNL